MHLRYYPQAVDQGSMVFTVNGLTVGEGQVLNTNRAGLFN